MLKRMSQNDEATIVFHECFRARCRDMRNSARTDSAPHNAVLDVFSQLVVKNGVTNAAVFETRLSASDGSNFHADVFFFYPSSGARFIVKVVSMVTSDPTLHWGEVRKPGLKGVNARWRVREV